MLLFFVVASHSVGAQPAAHTQLAYLQGAAAVTVPTQLAYTQDAAVVTAAWQYVQPQATTSQHAYPQYAAAAVAGDSQPPAPLDADSENAPSQIPPMAPTDVVAPSPLPTPAGSPVSLGPTNPQEAPAVAIPPWHKHAERPPPSKRQRPNGIFELWHPHKAPFFLLLRRL